MFKNGKLFGKINVIDLLVILVVLVAVAAVALFVLKPKDGEDTLIMKFRIEEVDDFVASKVKKGVALYDDTYLLDLGVVCEEPEVSESISYGGVTDGIYTVGTKEGYKSMIITGECTGTKTKLGAEIGGKKYGVGHTFVLRAGDAKLYLRVYDIMLKEDYEKQKKEAGEAADNTREVKISLYTPEIETYIAESIKEGTLASNADKSQSLGTVTNVTVAESKSYIETDEGILLVSKPEYSSLTVECTALGEITEEGIKINGKLFSTGDTFTLRAGSTKVFVKVNYVGE